MTLRDSNWETSASVCAVRERSRRGDEADVRRIFLERSAMSEAGDVCGRELGERILPNEISRFERLNRSERLLSRPPGTFSSIPNGGEGRGEEVLRFMERTPTPYHDG